MDVIFFLLLLISFVLGVVIILLLYQNSRVGIDPGTRSLLAPLIPLTLITGLQILSYYLVSRFPAPPLLLMALLFEWSMIAVAFGWNYLACLHYDLNGKGSMERRKIVITAILSGILFASAPVVLFTTPRIMPFLNAMIILMLYHAGIKGVLIFRKKRKILPSSRAAVTVAALSLAGYPLIAVGDVLGWRFPLLDGEISFWVQAHPLYVFLVNIPLIIFLIRHPSWPAFPKGSSKVWSREEIRALLSTRERQVFELLYQGYRYEDMASRLYLSLATIKTHVHHIYRKLGINRREELFRRIRDEGFGTKDSSRI